MEQKPTYEEAKKAKEILLEYLEVPEYVGKDEYDRNRAQMIVYLALKQDYFLD
jgi:hypothetical protein